MDRIFRDKSQYDSMKDINTNNIATNYQSTPWPVPYHLHPMDNIINLNEELDQKAQIYHLHRIDEIVDLPDVLVNKADLSLVINIDNIISSLENCCIDTKNEINVINDKVYELINHNQDINELENCCYEAKDQINYLDARVEDVENCCVDVKYSVNDLDNRVENLEDFQNSVVGTDKPVNDTYATRNSNGDTYFNNLFVVGKLDVGGLIDPTGLVLNPQSSNPGGVHIQNTIWINSTSGHVYRGDNDLEDSYSNEINQIESNIDELNNCCIDLTIEIDDLWNSQNQIDHQINDLENCCLEVKADMNELQNAIQDININDLENCCYDLRAEVNELQNTIQNININDLENCCYDLRAEINVLQNAIQDININDLENCCLEVRDSVNDLWNSQNQTDSQINDLENCCLEVRDSVNDLWNSQNQAEFQINDLENCCIDTVNQISEIQNSINSIENQIDYIDLYYNYTYISNVNYIATSLDDVIGVDTSTTSVTISLPSISTLPNNKKKMYIIKDEGQNSSNQPITINSVGSDTFENGSSSISINLSGTAIRVYSNLSNKWFII